MRPIVVPASSGLLALFLTMADPSTGAAQQPSGWKQHEMNRPRPPVVQPVQQTLPAPAPADAIVLFGGSDLGAWQKPSGSAAG